MATNKSLTDEQIAAIVGRYQSYHNALHSRMSKLYQELHFSREVA